MQSSTLKIWGVPLAICILTALALEIRIRAERSKVGYADAVRLFDGFNMKMELEHNEKVKLESMGLAMDSLKKKLQMVEAAGDAETVKSVGTAFQVSKQELEQEYARGNKEISSMVWKRLNPLVSEYGKQSGIRLLMGANGMGSILYADSSYDRTEELIKYVNKRYADGN